MSFHSRPFGTEAPAEVVAAATCPPIMRSLFPPPEDRATCPPIMRSLLTENGAESVADVLFVAELTGRCNLRCTHCYADAGPRVRDDSFMTPERWKAAFRWARQRGYRNLQLIGGEPMLHPAFAELLECGTGLGFAVEVFSNGTIYREAARAALLRSAPHMAFSLYGASADVHDGVTKVAGSFERTAQTLRWCAAHGLTTRIAFIDAAAREGEFERVREMFAPLVHDIQPFHVRPVGRGRDIAQSTQGDCGQCGRGMIALAPSGEFFPCAFGRHPPLGRIGEGAYAEVAVV